MRFRPDPILRRNSLPYKVSICAAKTAGGRRGVHALPAAAHRRHYAGCLRAIESRAPAQVLISC